MNRAKILLLEDERSVLQALQQILHGHGDLEIATATDGADAWRLARTFKPDLIVSDFSMPGLNGFELCQKIKADPDLTDTMFVVLTGYTDTRLKVSGLDLGVDDYLTKPVEAPEFVAKIRATLRVKALHDELRRDREELKQLHIQLGSSFDHLLTVLINLMDLRIPGASTRGDLFAKRARAIADRMKVPKRFLYDLELAARLHEIGKLVEHPEEAGHEAWHYLVTSRAILEQVVTLRGAADLLGSVGENWDGTGKPDHLLQGQIPLRSRILRVLIDLYAHWAHDVAEPQATTLQQAIGTLQRFGGTRYDPLVLTHLEACAAEARDDWRPTRQRVPLTRLEAGMVLAEDLCTSSGIKLLGQGATLTDGTLNVILKRHSSDPVLYGACVEQ